MRLVRDDQSLCCHLHNHHCTAQYNQPQYYQCHLPCRKVRMRLMPSSTFQHPKHLPAHLVRQHQLRCSRWRLRESAHLKHFYRPQLIRSQLLPHPMHLNRLPLHRCRCIRLVRSYQQQYSNHRLCWLVEFYNQQPYDKNHLY